jgi:membrane dipeptidase
MSYIIDGHQDIAYNALTFGRNYLRSAAETRRLEMGTPTPERTGHTLLGWPEYQRGQVAVIFSTLFLSPRRYQGGDWETQFYADSSQARRLWETQLDYYHRLCDEHPDAFRMILNQKDLRAVLEPWDQTPAFLPPRGAKESQVSTSQEEQEPPESVTHPVGLVLLMEGAEGIRSVEEMEEWWQMGVRMVGPVWAGTRFCGGMYEPGGFTREGYALMEVMGSLGMTLDISHMTEESALEALDRYEGPVMASHANARALIKGAENERNLTDRTMRRLFERGGVMGVVPFNRFLRSDWSNGDDRELVKLKMVAAQIDYICQMAGDAHHAALGTDFDGGFGWPAVPLEIDTIADLQKLAPILTEYGYAQNSIDDIMGLNWRRHLERTLPAS